MAVPNNSCNHHTVLPFPFQYLCLMLVKFRYIKHPYTELLPDAAINAFDKRLPQNVSQCSTTLLRELIANNGPVSMLGGGWECQSVSRAGRQRDTMDPRFHYFYDLVRIINFFQL